MNKKKQAIQALVVLVAAGVVALATDYMTSAPGTSQPVAELTSEEARTAKRLKQHVVEMTRIGERRAKSAYSMKKASELLHGELRRMGYSVVERPFQLQGETYVNLEVEISGASNAREIVVVGAHYDTHRRSPGADDNASGCAVLLELARELRGQTCPRSLRLVFFALGEKPHLGTDEMGSRAWIRDAEKRGETVVAMLALDSLGVYYDAPSSQHYPFPLGFYYPDAGDFVGFLGNLGSRDLVHVCVRAFRETGRMPAEGLAAPGWMPGVKMSDHASFWRAGVPAVLVTDTLGWRNLNYHDPLDTADYLDYERMARVVTGLLQVVRRLVMPAAA